MLRILFALSLYACRVACKYGSISRFKGVFRGVWGVCVGLCCLGALRGLCGFLCACIVRRIKGLQRICLSFVLFCPLSCPFAPVFAFFYARCLSLSSCFVFVGSLGVVVVSFSLADGFRHKKKGRKVLFLASSLVLLWVALFENRGGFFISYSCRPLALLERPEKRRYMWQFWNKYHKAIF